jgi:lipopolysaccharide export system protein LptA
MVFIQALFQAAYGESEPTEKIHVTAQNLVVDDADKFAEFTGNVKAVQGKTIITADRLKIFYEGSPDALSAKNGTSEKKCGIRSLEASGHVIILFDTMTAQGEKAVYTTADRVLVLSGPEASVTRPESGSISAAKIIVNRVTGRIRFESNVDGTFFPGDKGLN